MTPVSNPANAPSQGRVLVVDDSAVVRAIITSQLRQAGFEVSEAADGASALRLLGDDPDFDVVLTDLRMPSLDGFGLLDAIRRQGLDADVIVLTGSLAQDSDAAIRAFRLGAKDFLAKPAPQEAVAAVGRAVERRRHRAQLREAEDRYRRLFESNPHPMWVYDRETLAFLEVNDAAVRHYGYSREEFLGMTLRDIRPPEEIQPLLDNVSQVPAGLDAADVWRHRKKDGSTLEVEVTSHSTEFSGRPARLVLVNDITERRRAEEALAESERRHRRFVESLSERYIFYRHDRQGHFTYLSPSITRVLGYSGEDYRAHYATMFTDSPVNIVGVRHTEGTLRGETQPPYEIEVRAKDGSIHRMEVAEYPVRDGRGVVTEVEGIARDITDKWQAEQALRESEEKYRSFFDEDLAGNYVATPAGRLLACNTSFAQMFGFDSVEDALAAGLWSRYPSAAEKEAFLRSLGAQRRLKGYAHELCRRDGVVLRVIENAVGRFDGAGGLSEIHGYLIDDTERRRAEGQLLQSQKIDAVGQLAGGVAHDFNNLLSVIIGYCDLLHREIGVQHPGQPRLEQIRRAADRAAGLTRQLLAFSRKQVLEPRIFDLNVVVADVEKMLRRLIGEDIQLVTLFQEGVGSVLADPGQIEQVIVNLAVNARDAMPEGGRLIVETANVDLDEAYARAHPGARPGPCVLLTVRDNGCGIDAETLPRIFEPFFTTKERGKGTGLGLATVYGIVKQSEGYIAVDSAPGRGSTFRIYLPRVGQAVAEAPSHAGSAAGGIETILLLEDEESLRDIVREILESAGYRVLDCAEPEAALRVAQSGAGPIHLLLTDVVMPRMNGREVAKRIRVLLPGLPVLYMSGYAEEVIDRHGVLEAGMDFVAKPFTPEVILGRVRQALDRG